MITIYTTGPSCQKCNMTKRMFTAKGIAWEERDITNDPAARAYVTEELGYSTAPVVVVDEHDHWSDLRPDHIERIAAAGVK